MGSFTCLELARRGASVIGLDQFAPPHNRGSHTGSTRVFRTAYAEHPDYVPLAQRAGRLWEELGQAAGTVFLHRCGMLSLGPADSALISGIRASASAHGLPVEELPERDIRSRYPVFELPPGWMGIFEAEAGWVDVDAGLRFGLEQAERAGAHVRVNTAVESWQKRGGEFVLGTSAGRFTAKRLIITAGAWAGRLIADLKLPLRVLRKALIWVYPLRPEHFQPAVFPIFAVAEKFFYGFPNIGGEGVKLAIHCSDTAPVVNPDEMRSEPTPAEIGEVMTLAARFLPGLAGPFPGALQRLIGAKSCLYSMTPDEHFIVDRHPQVDNLYFAAGFSGHGYKFAPVIGEALADLALQGETALEIGFLRLQRLSG